MGPEENREEIVRENELFCIIAFLAISIHPLSGPSQKDERNQLVEV